MRNILINISANTIQVINALNNKLIQKIVNITSLFSNDDLEILLKYEESTLTLNYELIDGISIDGVAFYPPISYLDLLNQLQTIVVVKPLSSGGGSGGGDASSLNQLLGNSSLTAINNKLSNQATALKQDDTKSVLDNILLELKDDVNASETIWYDRITPTLFYIRRNSINQDTGVVTVIFYNVAGTVATPIISNLVQAISNSDFDFNTIERKAITNGVGYFINDRIQELQIINMSNGSLVNTIWVNKSTSLIISTPIFSHLIIDDSYANVTNQLLTNNKLDILHNDLINPTPAGNNIIGKFGIDQTNPGISNKVEVGVVTVNAGLDLNTSNLNLETTQQNVLLGINTVTNNTITLPDSLINIKETLLNIKAKDFATEQTLNTVNNSINTVTDNLTVLNRENTQQLIKNKTDNLDVLLSTRLKSSDTLAKVSTIDNITNTVTIKADTLANQINPLKIDGSGTIQPVSITSLPLPNGSSTSALQTTGNNKLDSIDIKTPALGQALVSNSTPVVLPASQIVALTPIAAITGFNLESTQQLIKAKTDNLDVLLSTRLKATDVLTGVVNVGSVTSITNALPAGNNNIGDVDIVTLPALVAGTAIIGKVGIDQSVPGTSNKVNIGSDGQVSTNGTIFNFSTLNSTTTQLLAGATYTGTIESIINQQAYSLLFFSDQNATITIRQFINVNGTGIISNISFNYIANSTNFSISKVANGNFIQVLVQNTGASATTALQLDTAFGTIPSSTILGNAPSAINEINGNTVSVNSGNSDAGTLRIMQAIESSTGIITTQNLVPNSAATLNSAVEILTNGANAISIQVTGTYTGALSVQLTNDGVRWETITFTSLLNCITGGFTNTIGSATIGIFQFKCSGFLKARITALTAVTGNALLTLRTIREANLIGIDNPLPTGTNNIGSVALISGQNLGSLTTLSNGQTAHSSTITGAPFRIGARVKTANDLTLVNNDATDLVSTTDSALIIKPFAVPELDWTFACPSPVNNTTDVVLRIAASAGLRNYLTSFQITNASATIATEIVIKDGVIIVWRGFVGVGTVLNSAVGVSFATPLRTTAATNLNFACITTGSSVYVNAQGYVAS